MYHYCTDLDFRLTMQGGLKILSIRLDSIGSTRIVSPVVDSSCRKSICARRDSVRIEASRKVHQTNRLSLGVLDMHGRRPFSYILLNRSKRNAILSRM